ncbi:protein mono-ADP-ribosyltransferase PARP12 [Bombina bombina]|uniref:protein mono-ADP-ribosyltransferase PARP12 n=1 Tax=Bombina bombina TaxID=8345 RepID=UPI00235A8060|nr:protein mono-ADP-ribosyltransferase PARP12 [Bombina bombina]
MRRIRASATKQRHPSASTAYVSLDIGTMSKSPDLSLRVRRVLCAHGGSMELGRLARSLGLTPQQVEQLLEKEQGTILAVGVRDEERVAVARSEVRLCSERTKKCAGDCGNLHLCRFYILGSCSRSSCKFNHDIEMDPNLRVLQEHKLNGISVLELRQLLLQNDPSLLPEACLHYNRGDGAHGSCTYKTNCNKLHICQHYLHGDCKFGAKCKRTHNLRDAETMKRLIKWGVSESLVSQLIGIYINAAILNGSSAPPSLQKRDAITSSIKELSISQKASLPQQVDEICLFFIRNSCSFKERCVRHHFNLPYKWQFYLSDTWKDFPNMEAIEKEYCDPNLRDCKEDINFDTMIFHSYKVRRLSTPSSASKPPHFILTTDWLWYWKDEYNKWIEYGKESNLHQTSSLSSSDLESVYLSDDSAAVNFKAGKHEYVLSFKDMVQRNVRYATERKVCRRPIFVSVKDVEEKKTRKKDQSKDENKSVPSNWDKGNIPDVGYKLVPIPQSSEEYKNVEAMFRRTLRLTQIQNIQRIQNLALWEVFQWQKEQMKKQHEGKEVDERQLFHGTSEKLIDAICQQNFDWRISGAHGTAYGKGSYFARDSTYSHNYSCRTDSHSRVMFVARVLVGDFINGKSSYLRPPPKESSTSTYYDSCVDSKSNPSIFVIFEKHQIYPEYLIRYTG